MKKDSFTGGEIWNYLTLSGFGLILIVLSLSVIISGCKSGDNGAVTPSTPILEGVFIDSPVEGLEYETPTHTGMTDENGTFMYHDGDTMRFYIGDVLLGEAMAKPMMTPLDLVEGATDETHPAVINMLRLIQTMDEDMNPENGITITEEMSDAMMNHMIDFNMDPDQFEYDPDVMMIMDTINEGDSYEHMRTMVSTEDAIEHFNNSMNDMMDDGGMM